MMYSFASDNVKKTRWFKRMFWSFYWWSWTEPDPARPGRLIIKQFFLLKTKNDKIENLKSYKFFWSSNKNKQI